MAEGQRIVEHPSSAAIFLVLAVAPEAHGAVRGALADVGGIRRGGLP
ncbi:MAG TPA: hypothetical protein VIJ33_08355 [Solirubrobacteraceae bacterium]